MDRGAGVRKKAEKLLDLLDSRKKCDGLKKSTSFNYVAKDIYPKDTSPKDTTPRDTSHIDEVINFKLKEPSTPTPILEVRIVKVLR